MSFSGGAFSFLLGSSVMFSQAFCIEAFGFSLFYRCASENIFRRVSFII
jgi:hypothetical protein